MPIEQFRIKVDQEVLDDLTCRLKHIRWQRNSAHTNWERGTNLAYLQSLISYWLSDYDWRMQEAKLNQFSQFLCNVDGIDLHFIHERGKGPNPIPIILTHGWPDSYLRYLKLIPLLTDPVSYGGNAEDSFDVIIPSIPGFGFSSYPTTGGINNCFVADLWAKLMTKELGYEKFIAGGGDLGSGITRYLAAKHPKLLYGIHLTDIGILRDLLQAQSSDILSSEEQEYRTKAQKWMAKEGAYMSIQSTKPDTLAYGLSDSPVGLAGWLIEKFHEWSDCNGNLNQSFTRDELITNLMIYWVTNSISSANAIYYENLHSLPPLEYISVPTGLALFAGDVLLPPKERIKKYVNVTSLTTIPSGGHFTAMEEPELMAEDIRTFCRTFRK
ncbi:MAG: Epoxide hydrolase domain protein [Herbinix sp.]|jgi:microsomal epoxide hydrolase|nr:Epoxide hydrolase domain protein [Herbinix sp.]